LQPFARFQSSQVCGCPADLIVLTCRGGYGAGRLVIRSDAEEIVGTTPAAALSTATSAQKIRCVDYGSAPTNYLRNPQQYWLSNKSGSIATDSEDPNKVSSAGPLARIDGI
jgi:hypothetical protein